MARSITLTLGVGLGADLGPNFNLTANVGVVTPSTATKTELLAGKSVSVDNLATQITVTSTGTCTNSITQTIPCIATTTTTSTSTTTSGPTTTTTTTAGSSISIVRIDVQNSLNVVITDVRVSGTSVTLDSPYSYPVSAANNTTVTGTINKVGVHTVVVYYNTTTAGQNITLTDSTPTTECQNTTIGNFTAVFSSKYLDGNGLSESLTIDGLDGTC